VLGTSEGPGAGSQPQCRTSHSGAGDSRPSAWAAYAEPLAGSRMSASQSLSRPVIRTAPLAKPLIMTAMTIHSKRIGVRFSWEVPRHGSRVGALDRLQALDSGRILPGVHDGLAATPRTLYAGRRPPILCCIRSRRCSVWADSSCSTSIRAPSSTSPRRDIRWYRSTLSANHDQQRPLAADDLRLLASAAWLIRRDEESTAVRKRPTANACARAT
jgi:hypothetical protein